MDRGPRKLVLLGDSVFDNGAYVRDGESVVARVRELGTPDLDVLLLAVDGSSTGKMSPQIAKVPRDATHLSLSLGGNDAMLNWDLLNKRVKSTAEALDLFHERVRLFARRYEQVLESLLGAGLPTAVCTIYGGDFPPPEAERAQVALCLFNDSIIQAALRRSLHVIELRSVCSDPTDFVSRIEPSAQGAEKIANALMRWLAPSTTRQLECVISA